MPQGGLFKAKETLVGGGGSPAFLHCSSVSSILASLALPRPSLARLIRRSRADDVVLGVGTVRPESLVKPSILRFSRLSPRCQPDVECLDALTGRCPLTGHRLAGAHRCLQPPPHSFLAPVGLVRLSGHRPLGDEPVRRRRGRAPVWLLALHDGSSSRLCNFASALCPASPALTPAQAGGTAWWRYANGLGSWHSGRG